MSYKPKKKYIVDYKCIVYDTLSNELNLPSKFFSWLSQNIKTIYPEKPQWEISYEHEQKRLDAFNLGINAVKQQYIEYDSIFEIPKHYDSSKDIEIYEKKKKDFIINMNKMNSGVSEKDLLENVNFGDVSFEWVNEYLDLIYDKYGKYYVDGKLKCWNGRDVISNRENIYDYPTLNFHKTVYYFSELKKWIQEIGIDTSNLYEWLIKSTYIEGRHWKFVIEYDIRDIEGYYNSEKKEIPHNIQQIHELFKQLFKEDDELIPIYMEEYIEYDKIKDIIGY